MFRYLISKLFIIVLCAVIGAAGLMYEKYHYSKFVIQSGKFVFGYDLMVKNYQDLNEQFHFEQYIKNINNNARLLSITENRFDYSKFQSNWNEIDVDSKGKWLNSHIYLSNYGAGRYGLQLIFNSNDYKDYEYVKLEGLRYLDAYVDYLNTIDSRYVLEKSNPVEVFPIEQMVETRTIQYKYGILGFIIGGVLGTAFFAIKFKRK